MHRSVRRYVEVVIPPRLLGVARMTRELVAAVRSVPGRHPRECSICGYRGKFFATGRPLRFDAVCPRCHSRERHRHHHLILTDRPDLIDGKAILHFAAESCFVEDYQQRSAQYIRADIQPSSAEDRINIEDIPIADASIDTVICHQLLEHVDDRKALRELHRILRPGGYAILSTPVIESWRSTFEDDSVRDPWLRDLYFGHPDHKRFFGRDVRQRIADAGFTITEFVAMEPDVSRYGLARGDVIFLARKSDS